MKTWLITGCSSGIGKGIAKAVLESGDQAIVTARNKDKVMDIVEAYPDRKSTRLNSSHKTESRMPSSA